MSDLHRHDISDALWEKIEPFCAGRQDQPGRTAKDNRLFINAVLFVIREGISWRSLPPEYGKWNTFFQRFRRWQKNGLWLKIMEILLQHSDCISLMIDSTFIKMQLSAAGAKGGNQALGRSKGGSTQSCIWPWMKLVCPSDFLLQMASQQTAEQLCNLFKDLKQNASVRIKLTIRKTS